MKKIYTRLFLFIFIAVFFSGCLEVNTTIHLNKDGSGTLEESVLMSSQVIQMISAFTSSFDSVSADTNKFNLFDEDKLIADTAKYGSGIKYISGKAVKENGKQGYNAIYSFEDINKLRINQNPNSKIDMEGVEFEEDSSKEFLKFKFIPGSPSLLTIKTPLSKNKDISGEDVSNQDTLSSDFQGMDEFLNLMKDMRISLKLDINGNITETNATYVNGSEITLFDMDFHDLFANPEKLKMFKKQNPKDIEEVKKIMKDIPGIKVEMNNEVNVRFD
jgi:hypothetical protein